MKVLRVWLDGQSTSQKVPSRPNRGNFEKLSFSTQGTNINPFPDLEPSQICNGVASCYDDTVLERLDDFMIDAHAHGIKVCITVISIPTY